MPGFHLSMSNRLETLADLLAQDLARGTGGPFATELLVVQSRGMQRWVSLQLARRLGVWANFRFLLPNEMVNALIGAALPGAPNERLFNTDIMTWRVMRLLPECAPDPAFAAIARYLGDDPAGLKRYQLAARIVDVFDQYLTYRPELILRWEGGADDDWQARLWRLLADGMRFSNPPRLQRDFFARLATPDDAMRAAVPGRISVFGVSSLPRFHLDVLRAASALAEITLYQLNPSPHYWLDLAPGRSIARRLGADGSATARDSHLERGNALLASMGRQGQDFLGLLFAGDPDDRYAGDDPGEDTLLHRIQHDIYAVVDRGDAPGGGDDDAARAVVAADGTVVVNACHSALREIEVLRDFVLDCFERLPGLTPGDIVVLAPDIEAYAPFAQAVFSGSGDGAPHVPISIVDRPLRATSPAIAALFALLELPEGRFEAGAVMGLLACPDIRRRRGLAEGDIDLLRAWIEGTRTTWGIDAAHRATLGLPATPGNTWAAGIDRLIAGYAMLAAGDERFGGVLPYDPIAGDAAVALGRLLSFLEALRTLHETLCRPKPLAEWRVVLEGALDDFFDPDEESARDLDAVRVFAARLPEVATGSDVDGTVSARLLAAFMADAIGASRGGGEFITGRLTFCALMPMRSVPFRVVCMIGMNDASFPRRDVPAGFNRIADEFRPGDRSLRDEDRYLFLESILSARDRLYISYCGQGVQDNRPIPPSIVVSELVDYIEQGHPECKPLVTRHPLQAFSPRYFRDDGALYTFSETQSAAARALLSRTAPPSFFPGPLIALPTEEREIALDTLAGFFTNPARALLEKRLGVRYGPIAGELRDEEPFTLEGIDAWRVNRHVLEGVLRGDSLDAIVDGLAARGELPHGGIGRGMVDALARGASAFHRALLPFLPEGDPPPRPFSLTIGAYRIVGAVPVPGPRGLTTYRYARCRASDRLRAWIAHCIMLLLDPASSGVSHFISLREKKDEIARFEMDAFDDAGGYLAGLMDLYDAGMRGPLPFFPRSSLVYAEEAARGKLSEPDARARARDAWLGSEFARGDADDEYVARLFSGADPIDARFAECARHVFMPMLAHQSEAKP